MSTRSRGGRPAAASPEQVLALARERYLAGQRIDLTELASVLGLGRATLYRWFGSREALVGIVIGDEFETLLAQTMERISPVGGEGLLELCDALNQSLARSSALRRFVETEREAALRLLTASDGPLQPRTVAAMEAVIETEVRAGRLLPPADPGTLAYAIVRLAEAFLYGDAAAGVRGDVGRLRAVQAALLGVPDAAWVPDVLAVAGVDARTPPLEFLPLAAAERDELRRIHRTGAVSARWGPMPAAFPFEDPDAVRFTIVAQGIVAGMVQYYEELDPMYRHANVDLFLEDRWHGQGIATATLRWLLERLVAAGHHRVTVDPAADNLPAIRAYRRAGFRPVGLLHAYERDPDGQAYHDGLLMEYVAGAAIGSRRP